ncbi:MAG: cache domain-containing protein, partial [Thermodesulfobacteriota bacterium]|nr:cache domain-containing protein [Thermodesulfobacteriota bacterium]
MMLNIRQIRNLSLKWKLLIPFFFLPAALTIILVAWGIHSQNQILTVQEEDRLRHNFRQFEQRIKLRLNVSMSLAAMVASDPAAQKILAEKDREALKKRYLPIYEQLEAFIGIKQFHFHIRPGVSFLRLHRLDRFGDELASYRRTITTAYKTGVLVGGLEYGVTGLGIRGVAPIYHEGRIVGSVECGWGVGQPFLNQLKKDMDCDLTIYTALSSDPSKFT